MLSQFLINLIFLLLPTQLGLHLWLSSSRVYGLKIDYLSPTLYFVYILVTVFLLVNSKILFKIVQKKTKPLTIFVVFAITNTLFSQNRLLSIYHWLEILILTSFYLLLNKKKYQLHKSLNCLHLGLIFTILLQFIQVATQKSVDGILYWLGERKFNYYTPSIPKISLGRINILRSPSFFSHANSLSGYLLLFLAYLQITKNKVILRLLVGFSLLLTFSKNAIFASSIIFFKKTKLQHILLFSLIFTLLILFIKPKVNQPYFIQSRLSGIEKSLLVIKNNPIFGTGLGAYLNQQSTYLSTSQIDYEHLQPVHSIYLLFLSETGIFGLLAVLYLFKQTKFNQSQQKLLSLILITGIFDHYWLTLPQNKLVIVVLLSLLSLKYKHEHIRQNSN